MSIPSTPASSKRPGPLSTPTNTPTPTPSESTPSTPEAVLVQVDHLSALPQELQNEIMDWVAPTLLSAEAKALGLTSKTLHQTLENHKEKRASELVEFSLRRVDKALASLPSLAGRSSHQQHLIESSAQLTETLQKCAKETGSAPVRIILSLDHRNDLLNEEVLAAFRNYEGRQLSIATRTDNNNDLHQFKRIAEIIPKDAHLKITVTNKPSELDPGQLKQLFDVLHQRSLLTSLSIIYPEYLPLASLALLMDFLTAPNPIVHLNLFFMSGGSDKFLDVFTNSLPKFNQLPLMTCKYCIAPNQQTLERCIAAVSEHNRLSALPMAVVFDGIEPEINYSNQPFSSEESLEKYRNNGIHFGTISYDYVPENLSQEVEGSLIRARDSYLAKSSPEKN